MILSASSSLLCISLLYLSFSLSFSSNSLCSRLASSLLSPTDVVEAEEGFSSLITFLGTGEAKAIPELLLPTELAKERLGFLVTTCEAAGREGFLKVIVSLLPCEERAGSTICPALPFLMAANCAGVNLITREALLFPDVAGGATGFELRVTTLVIGLEMV